MASRPTGTAPASTSSLEKHQAHALHSFGSAVEQDNKFEKQILACVEHLRVTRGAAFPMPASGTGRAGQTFSMKAFIPSSCNSRRVLSYRALPLPVVVLVTGHSFHL